MDRALWISWYDLPGNQEGYLSWLHDTYIPRLLERPGVLWVAHYASEDKAALTGKQNKRKYPVAGSVPTGHDFMLLVGAEHAHVFAAPTPRQYHAQLPQPDRKILALRTNECVNVMIEEARVDGLETPRRDAAMALSPCIQLGSFRLEEYDDEDELLGWYAQWRMPSMTQMPGCVGVRKLVSVSGWAKHAILHEFESVEARNQNFVDHEKKRHPEKAAWSEKVTGTITHAPGSPNVGRRIWSAVKNQ